MINFLKLSIAILLLMISTFRLPHIIKEIHILRLKILNESKASSWPKALTLPSR